MKIVQLNNVPKKRIESEELQGVSKQVPIGVAEGSPTMSLRVFTVDPGGYTPYHSHPWEHINYILAGAGAMVDESGAEHAIVAGDYAFVAPNEKHQFRNTSTGDALQFICLVPTERE